MIRKLTEADRASLMTLLHTDTALNLFIIGDVENFGFEQDFMELWGEMDEPDGRIKAVMLRFYGSFLPYAEGPFDVEGFAELLRRSGKAKMISGSSKVVRQFSQVLECKSEKQMFFAELKDMNEAIRAAAAAPGDLQSASLQDVEAICSLTDLIEEFSGSSAGSRQTLHKALESKTGRTYFVKKDGQPVATASTAAENSLSAMIISVATHPEYRGQGFATQVVARLSADVLAEGRSLCLFYNNPQAGMIYQKLGFTEIGTWSMLYI